MEVKNDGGGSQVPQAQNPSTSGDKAAPGGEESDYKVVIGYSHLKRVPATKIWLPDGKVKYEEVPLPEVNKEPEDEVADEMTTKFKSLDQRICPQCNEPFHKNSLKRHMMRHHGMSETEARPPIKEEEGEEGKECKEEKEEKEVKAKPAKKPFVYTTKEVEGCQVVFKISPYPEDRKKVKEDLGDSRRPGMGNFNCGGCKKNMTRKKMCVTIEFEVSDSEGEEEDTEKVVEEATVNIKCGKVCHLCDMHFERRYELHKHLIQDHQMTDLIEKLHRRDWAKCLPEEEIQKLEKKKEEEEKEEKVCERQGCHKLIVGRKAYMDHIFAVHKGQKKVFECSTCQATFKKKVHLNKHKMIHTGLYPYMCSECGRQFNDKGNMLNHMKIHDRAHNEQKYPNTLTKIIMKGENPQAIFSQQNPNAVHVCDQCGKSFYNFVGLKVHAKVHEPKKTHTCNVCNETFTNTTDFKFHKQGHLGHKQYQCAECGKKCPNKSYWEEHMNKHTGARPYVCSECGKAFKQKSTLVGHYKKLHTKLPTLNPRFDKPKNMACPYCDEMFTSRIPLGKHVSKTHPEVYQSYTKMLRALNKQAV